MMADGTSKRRKKSSHNADDNEEVIYKYFHRETHHQNVDDSDVVTTAKDGGGEGAQSTTKANLIIQVSPSHTARLQKYVPELFEEETQFLVRTRPQRTKDNKSQDHFVMYQCPDPYKVLVTLRDDVHLSHCIRRVYIVDGWQPNLEAAVDKAVQLAIQRGYGPEDPETLSYRICPTCGGHGKIIARFQQFPRQLLYGLLEKYQDSGSIHLCSQGYSVIINILELFGGYFYGVGDPSVFLGHMASSSSVDDKKSKAFYKIREAFLRGKLWKGSSHFMKDLPTLENNCAMDVGAAPGGWSAFLATELNYKRVIAIDSGLLTEPVHPNIVHVKMKAQDAVSTLEKLLWDKSSHSHEKVDTYLCDMNVNPTLTLKIFTTLSKFCCGGTRVVLTLKNFCGNNAVWRDEVRQCKEVAEKYLFYPQSVSVLHLLCNAPKEKTLSGILLPSDKRQIENAMSMLSKKIRYIEIREDTNAK